MDTPVSRSACWLALMVAASVLLGRGVTAASVRPEEERRLFIQARTITRGAERTEALVTVPLVRALESCGSFSLVSSLSGAGSLAVTARLRPGASSFTAAGEITRLLSPRLEPFCGGEAPFIHLSSGFADHPAAYLLFTPAPGVSPPVFSREIERYIRRLSATLRECGEVRLLGTVREEYTVTADPGRAALSAVTIPALHRQLSELLSGSTCAGVLENGSLSFPVVIAPAFAGTGEIARLPVSGPGRTPVPLGSIARIGLDLLPPEEPVWSPADAPAAAASFTALTPGDIGFYHALAAAAAGERCFTVEPRPSGVITERVRQLRVLPFAAVPLLIILFLFPERGRNAAAMLLQLFFSLLMLLIDGTVTPRSLLTLLSLLPLAPLFRLRSWAVLGFIQFALLPAPASGRFLLLSALLLAPASGPAADRIIDDGFPFSFICLMPAALFSLAACLVIAPPFVSALAVRPVSVRYFPPGEERKESLRGSWRLVSAETGFLPQDPWVVPPGCVTCFFEGDAETRPFPGEIRGDVLRVTPHGDSRVSEEESAILAGGILGYLGTRVPAGTVPPDSPGGIPLSITLEERGGPEKTALVTSDGIRFLSQLADVERVRSVIYIHRTGVFR